MSICSSVDPSFKSLCRDSFPETVCVCCFSKDETYQLHFGESNQKVNDLKKLVPTSQQVSSLDLQHHLFGFQISW